MLSRDKREHGVFVINTSVGLLRKAQEITAGLAGFATICERRLFGSTGLFNSMGYDLHLGSMCGHDLGSTAFTSSIMRHRSLKM